MFVSAEDGLKIHIDELNISTPDEVTWCRGFQNEEVVKVGFEFDLHTEEYILSESLRNLRSEIREKTDYTLTGVEYDISDHEGELVFSSIRNIEPNTNVGELLSRSPDSITIPKTLAYEDTVTCTGSFVAFFDWGYETSKIRFSRSEGMYITAIASDVPEKNLKDVDMSA